MSLLIDTSHGSVIQDPQYVFTSWLRSYLLSNELLEDEMSLLKITTNVHSARTLSLTLPWTVMDSNLVNIRGGGFYFQKPADSFLAQMKIVYVAFFP